MSQNHSPLIIGIDPAPSKATWFCYGRLGDVPTFERCVPTEVRAEIERLVHGEADVVVLWDAPLRLDPGNFHNRRIDRATAAWIKSAETRGLLGKAAVGVSAAAQCPHNLLTQHVWGLPVGKPAFDFGLVDPGTASVTKGRWLAEVHPAVAAAAWWIAFCGEVFERYKTGGRQTSSCVAASLKRLSDFFEAHAEFDSWGPAKAQFEAKQGSSGIQISDDHLDAWMAWRLGVGLIEGDTHVVGPVDGGTYVLPQNASWKEDTDKDRTGKFEVR
jgi:hypothetical protein